MLKQSFIRVCILLCCMPITISAMEYQYIPNCFRYCIDEITHHIETCYYVRALDLVVRSKNNTFFIGLIKTNSRIVNFCSQHKGLLELFREKVVIGQNMQPTVFFSGNYERSDFSADVLVQAYMHILGSEKLKDLLLLLNELFIMNAGVDYFEPVVIERVDTQAINSPLTA